MSPADEAAFLDLIGQRLHALIENGLHFNGLGADAMSALRTTKADLRGVRLAMAARADELRDEVASPPGQVVYPKRWRPQPAWWPESVA